VGLATKPTSKNPSPNTIQIDYGRCLGDTEAAPDPDPDLASNGLIPTRIVGSAPQPQVWIGIGRALYVLNLNQFLITWSHVANMSRTFFP
jgi:hypothetical protein